jgi:hypothetical protein
VGAFLIDQHQPRRDRAPYKASEVRPRISLTIVDAEKSQAAVDALIGSGRLRVPDVPGAGQRLIGTLDFDIPPNASTAGDYALFVVDRRLSMPVPSLYAVGPEGSSVAQGWDSAYDKVAKRYGWASAVASASQPGESFANPGMAVNFPADTTSPIVFVAAFDPTTSPVSNLEQEVSVALALLGVNGQVHWAVELA